MREIQNARFDLKSNRNRLRRPHFVSDFRPPGAIVNVNGNNLQASYEGGDGNGLTLTVVQ